MQMDADGTYRNLYLNPSLMEHLVRGFVDPDIVKNLNFSTLKPGPTEFLTPAIIGEEGSTATELARRRTDLTWTIEWNGFPLYLLVHLEFQSQVDRFMAVRMLVYEGLLWQHLIKTGIIAANGQLPPILPIVFYTGNDNWTAPLSIRDLLAPMPVVLEKHQPAVQYLYLDEQKTDIDGERGQRNIVVQLFKIARHPDPTQWPDLKEETNRLICDCLAHPFQDQVLKDLNIWLRHHAKMAGIPSKIDPFSKEPSMLQAILSWKERTMAEGKADGLAEGEARGKAEGEARGKAEGAIATLRSMVHSGIITVDAARTQVHRLQQEGEMTAEMAAKAISQLG